MKPGMAEHGVPVAPTPDLTQMNATVGLLRGFIEWMCKEALPYPGRTQPDEFAFSLVQQVTSACSDVADRLGLPSIWREKLNYVDTHALRLIVAHCPCRNRCGAPVVGQRRIVMQLPHPLVIAHHHVGHGYLNQAAGLQVG